MRLALNGWFLAHDPHTGTGQYLRALLEWLPRVAPQHEYHLVAPAIAPARPEALAATWQVRAVPCGSSHPDKVRFEQILFPRACRALRADLAHVPYWAPPLASPAPVVVTIHDLIPRILPEYRGGLRMRLYTALVSAATQGAALALADSEASRRDILTHLRLPPEKVRTVHLAADARYSPRSGFLLDEAVRQKYDLPDGYVLYLGGFDARKNVRALLSAWTWVAGAVGESYPLVLGGDLPGPDGRLFDDYPRLARELEVADTVRFIGPVDEADKPALYRGAAVFVYPSRYEGFGLPPLEAMACGVPVVASSAASLPEVVGQAGYLLPPDDTRSFGAAIITCIVESSVSDDLRQRGLAQAGKFSWEKTARQTVAAYEAVLHG
jgi:glycosyltransferase involved in cell wall biosynthesis